MNDDISQYVHNGTVNVDEIVGVGARVPGGRYVAKLIAVEGKASKKGNDMIEARYEIISGKDQQGNAHDGEDIVAWYSLVVRPPKKAGQKPFAAGIVEMKTAFAAVGAPLPAGFGFPLDPQQAAKVFAKALGKKQLDLVVLEEKTKDEEGNDRTNTRVKIVGLAGKPAAAAPTAAAAAAPAAEAVDDLL